MSDFLQELYQEVIVDHSKQPRNFHGLKDANHQAHGHNPLCGDNVEIFVSVENGAIKDVSFQGEGCAISTASASIMTEAIKGMSVQQAKQLSSDFREALVNDQENNLGKLEVLKGVKQYPMRVKCATLAWHTLQAALDEQNTKVSTEE